MVVVGRKEDKETGRERERERRGQNRGSESPFCSVVGQKQARVGQTGGRASGREGQGLGPVNISVSAPLSREGRKEGRKERLASGRTMAPGKKKHSSGGCGCAVHIMMN